MAPFLLFFILKKECIEVSLLYRGRRVSKTISVLQHLLAVVGLVHLFSVSIWAYGETVKGWRNVKETIEFGLICVQSDTIIAALVVRVHI